MTNNVNANNSYFSEGLTLFEKKEFDKAKFKFEQDIVFNPKSEKSYLYLSKIFNIKKEKELEEKNLNTVILLNPNNEEAVFNLAELRLGQSNYKESKKLTDKLLKICKKYCQKGKSLKVEIENSLKK
tara:strand:+ start:539 stop:919 length:381 start_codon:yes stop_codon:yes gene_type:complete